MSPPYETSIFSDTFLFQFCEDGQFKGRGTSAKPRRGMGFQSEYRWKCVRSSARDYLLSAERAERDRADLISARKRGLVLSPPRKESDLLYFEKDEVINLPVRIKIPLRGSY